MGRNRQQATGSCFLKLGHCRAAARLHACLQLCARVHGVLSAAGPSLTHHHHHHCAPAVQCRVPCAVCRAAPFFPHTASSVCRAATRKDVMAKNTGKDFSQIARVSVRVARLRLVALCFGHAQAQCCSALPVRGARRRSSERGGRGGEGRGGRGRWWWWCALVCVCVCVCRWHPCSSIDSSAPFACTPSSSSLPCLPHLPHLPCLPYLPCLAFLPRLPWLSLPPLSSSSWATCGRSSPTSTRCRTT